MGGDGIRSDGLGSNVGGFVVTVVILGDPLGCPVGLTSAYTIVDGAELGDALGRKLTVGL